MEVCLESTACQPDHERRPELVTITPKTYAYPLLRNVHLLLPRPASSRKGSAIVKAGSSTFLTRGDFTYFHYQCDGFPDSGWGCAYRTLQSACSWILGKRMFAPPPTQTANDDVDMDAVYEEEANDKLITAQVPSLLEIQHSLVHVGDKPASFVGSRDWIGALEVFYVLDTLYDVPCKILHVPQREDLKKYANVLKKYFEDFGGFVMMGGNVDAASKGIAGIHISGNQAYFLVIDPHFVGKPNSTEELIERGYIRWQHTSEFVDSSFYNLCLPQLK